MGKTRLYFTVTNDLTYDQRMHRICGTLASAGYDVTLVGRARANSVGLVNEPYRQIRIRTLFDKGMLFYASYNIQLFFYLLFRRMDLICAIDLDTILPCLLLSKIKTIPRVFDAHEYFTELKEVRTRPRVRKVWSFIEKVAIPRFNHGYTVSEGLADAFERNWNRNYQVIRNLPLLREINTNHAGKKFNVFQGAVNEARGFEYLIPAMRHIDYPLVICGDGNFMEQLKHLIKENGVTAKISLRGMLPPAELREIAGRATLGIALAEAEGINQFHALPNKFLEYMHAGLPQLAMNFPEYQKINQQFEIAVLIDKLEPTALADTINSLMADDDRLSEMRQIALEARKVFCWQNEEQKLIEFYKSIFS